MKSPENEKTLVVYVASPHKGYLDLFRKYAGGRLFVLGDEFIAKYPSLTRNLPGIDPKDAVLMIEALGLFNEVEILTLENIRRLAGCSNVVMPDEDVAHALVEEYLSNTLITFDSSWKLRWDKGATNFHREPEGQIIISEDRLDSVLMGQAEDVARRSPDWWRQIGALLVRDGNVVLAAYNNHLPSEQSAYLLGDPRSNFEPGISIDMSLAIHAENALFVEAARRGISTEGCDLYVTTFPCPPCANACALSGIRRLFYRDGYSLVAGAEALRSRGVEIIRVQ